MDARFSALGIVSLLKSYIFPLPKNANINQSIFPIFLGGNIAALMFSQGLGMVPHLFHGEYMQPPPRFSYSQVLLLLYLFPLVISV